MPRKPRPGDHPCADVYGPKYEIVEKRGQPCEQPAAEGDDYCVYHHGVPEERRCRGKLAKDHPTDPGGRCPCPALVGQKICGIHGGRSEYHRSAAQRRREEERARDLMTIYGTRADTTPTEALLAEVQWTAGHVEWLRERVQELEEAPAGTGGEHPLVWGVTRRKTGGEDRGVTEEAAPSIWLKLYQAERNHLIKVCDSAIKAGIEERRVRIAESQGALVAQVIRAILDDLGLSPDQQAKIPEIVPRHLRALAS